MNTYIDDEKVQPAPGVGEVLDEAVRHPLQQHLQDEDVREHLVRELQHRLHCPPLLDVDVLKGLSKTISPRSEGLELFGIIRTLVSILEQED